MFIPSLHDHDRFHENGLQELFVENLTINHDGGVWFVGGNIQQNSIGIAPQWINMPVYGKADAKASSIYFHSCVKVGVRGHVPIPYSIIAVINSDDQIVDLKCATCRHPDGCNCDI